MDINLLRHRCQKVSRKLELIRQDVRTPLCQNPVRLSLAAIALLLPGCGGGGSEVSAPGDDGVVVAPPPPTMNTGAFATQESTARFLTQATFGPTPSQVNSLIGSSASTWFVQQLEMSPTLNEPQLEAYEALASEADGVEKFPFNSVAPTFAFWRNSISAPDQLRQRMVFALSQILVVSDFSNDFFVDVPEPLIGFHDILAGQAFGNYRDLLESVTYSPTMGVYLTYIGNQKADSTGRVPDENYARELLQLFTVGVVELEPNGEPRLVGGRPVELYSNADITGLARVFTGLDLEGLDRNRFPSVVDIFRQDTGLEESFLRPMSLNNALHSSEEKRFLNCSIAVGTGVTASIDQALDCIMSHPNVGPFVSRQLIQRFTTSDPDPAYVQRVASAFDSGRYALPSGRTVGDGRKGDLSATLAAILFDDAARADAALSDPTFGKIREPILRFTAWARAFQVDASFPEYALQLEDVSRPEELSQHSFRSRSVFNFYRPGFVAPGTQSGARGMTVPELQIVDASSNTGYINFMTEWVFGGLARTPLDQLAEELTRQRIVPLDRDALARAWRPDYSAEIEIANDPTALVARLNRNLTYGTLSDTTASSIEGVINQIALGGIDDQEARDARVKLAVLLIVTSPDFLVQR